MLAYQTSAPDASIPPQKCTFLQKSPPLGLGAEGHVPQQLEITLRMLEVVPGLAGNSRERSKLPFPAVKKSTHKTSKLSFMLSFQSQPSLSVATSAELGRL